MIRVKFIFFAALKELIAPEIECTIPEKTSITKLRTLLIEKYANARELLTSSRFAINEEFVNDEFILTGEDVLVMPPSSGG